MLNEEEKKAIADLKKYKEYKFQEYAGGPYLDYFREDEKQDIETVLNLIGKLQKESEEHLKLEQYWHKQYQDTFDLLQQEKEKNKKLDTIIHDMAFELTHYERWVKFDSDEVIRQFEKEE